MILSSPSKVRNVVLSVEDLCIEVAVSGASKPVLQGVSLDLAAGEILGIVGESGAGKSTLGLSALGYVNRGLAYRSGHVRYRGADLFEMSHEQRCRLRGSRIAYVAQSAAAAFNPALRLIDQLTEVARVSVGMSRGDALLRTAALLKRLNLPATIGDRYPHQVSGGQLQRVMTAMAMLCEPDVIVFDEPTTALDVTTQVEVAGLIRAAIRNAGAAALYVSHDLALVAQMADRIAVMRHGRIVEIAETENLMIKPKSEYTRALWAVRNLRRYERGGGTPLLRIEGLHAGYRGGECVLQDLSLDLPRGATTAVVGESGCGKSTLARVVAGFLPPRKGRILLQGKPLAAGVAGRSLDTLRRIQFVRQTPDTALNPRHTVAKLIGRPLALYFGVQGSAGRRQVAELLDMVELEQNLCSRTPAELSGGQKQRVALACALAAKPDLLICDEITSALDQLVQESILKLLSRIQEETGTTCLLITHDIATVKAVADYVAIMRQGRIVEQGKRSEVFSPPLSSYTDLLVSSTPQMEVGWLDRVIEAHQPAMQTS